MSFCVNVKNELIAIRPSDCCKPSLSYGFMLFGRAFSIKKISIQTANENVAKAYSDSIFSVYNIRPVITRGGKKIPTYKAEIVSDSDRLKILASSDFGVADNIIDRSFFIRDCCIQSFIRGAFLSCGNINDPNKEYRLEFNIKSENLADEFLSLLEEFHIILKKIVRGKGATLYTRDSEVIEDLLTLMGVGKIALEIMDTKVEKSFKNNINRARNCDDANISKTVEASIKQRKAIEFLEKSDRLESLPEELLQAAILRKNNPEASLKELCKISSVPITVSGLNHRLKRIIDIYEKIK